MDSFPYVKKPNLMYWQVKLSHFLIVWLAFFSLLLVSSISEALPLFARQTGQNCVACHAGAVNGLS